MLSHHEGEDNIGFPYLKKNVEGLNVEKLIEDHKTMHPLIVEAQGLLKETPPGQTAPKLREIVVDLRLMWLNHIGDEEECFGCELISQCLSVEGAESLGKQFSAHGRAKSKPASRMLPFVYYSLEGADREYIGKSVPGFVRNFLVPKLWKPSWKSMQQFLLPA